MIIHRRPVHRRGSHVVCETDYHALSKSQPNRPQELIDIVRMRNP